MTPGIDRRHVLTSAAASAVALPLLAACGGGTEGGSTDVGSSAPVDTGGPLTPTADVPVGGCAVFAAQKVVVTQPTEGDFKAFSAVCTHRQCTVSNSTEGVIPCMCHGSEFSLADGSVVRGPATEPLAEVAIAVDGDSITLA